MLSLLIVEDEDVTREGLTTLIDWESLGIKICGLAANGVEALRVLENEQADLVLTDIRMPLMDGLQLVSQIRERKWDISVILLSGYGDFEYAQRALRLGISDYLVKPCSPDEIQNVFTKISKEILKQRKFTDEMKGLEQQLHVNIPLVKTQILQQWLNFPPLVTENRREQQKSVRMNLGFEHVIVVAFRIDNKTIDNLNYSSTDFELLSFAASNIIKETLEQALLQPIEVVKEQDNIVVICNGYMEWMEEKLNTGLTRVLANLKEFLMVTVSAGISNSTPDINLLHIAYEEALNALELRFYRGSGKFYFYQDIAELKKENLPTNINQLELLKLEQSALEHLRAGLFAEVLTDTERWLEFFQADYTHSRKQINLRTLSFLDRMMQLTKEKKNTETDLFQELGSIDEQVSRIETLEELAGFVYRTIRQIIEALNSHKTPKRKVQQTQDYIAEHYNSSSLSLAGVAKALFVSSTYLSTLFKQELGINFLDYVHQYRIEKAKALLQSKDQKIHTVAKEVGYFDEAHFTKTFKKWTGMLPSQYKKENSL
jgi:two-component system, response regulator YesN